MFKQGKVQVFPHQIAGFFLEKSVCFPSEKAMFGERKGYVFSVFRLRSLRFRASASRKSGFPPRFSSRFFVKNSLSH